MALARFLLQDSQKRVQFFEETFFLAKRSMEMVMRMPSLVFNNTNFQFDTEKFTWRSYTVVEALPIIGCIKLIDKKKFAKWHWTRTPRVLCYTWQYQKLRCQFIYCKQLRQLFCNETGLLLKFLAKYVNYVDVFYPTWS